MSSSVNYSKIINECGIETEPPQEVAKRLASLEEFYSASEVVEILNYILQNANKPEILSVVIKQTLFYKDKTTLQILVDMLLKNTKEYSDEIIDLRVHCAKAISEYKDTSTLSALLRCMNNKNENYKVRLACADALGRIGDNFAVIPLINVVKDEEEKSVYLKETAAFALGLIGDKSAVDPLVAVMEAKQGIWDKFSFLKEKIIEVLGMLNLYDNKVLRVYKSSLSDSSSMVRINTIEALMNSDFEEAPELIRTALHDSDEEVQKNALIALYNLQGRDILDEVISLPGYSKFLKEEAEKLIEEYEEEE